MSTPKHTDKPKERRAADELTLDFESKDCQGNHKNNCDVLRAWGLAWQSWGEEVRMALRNVPGTGGGPTNVSPPPPPPFKP